MPYNQYSTLSISHSVADHVVRPEDHPPEAQMTSSSPALVALQDFRLHPPATLLDRLSIENATPLFKVLQLRYLLVENARGDFQGILAASDVLGPKLLTRMREHHESAKEIQVRDIMIPRRELWSIPYAALRNAKVGDVLHTLEVIGQSFLCVHDGNSPTSSNLRGVFCARNLVERLGERWDQPLRARSFSELGSTLLGKAELAS